MKCEKCKKPNQTVLYGKGVYNKNIDNRYVCKECYIKIFGNLDYDSRMDCFETDRD